MSRRTCRKSPHKPQRAQAPTETVAVIRTGAWPPEQSEASRFLEWEFLRWTWEARFPTWTAGLRALAVTLHGLERIGLIERERHRHGTPNGTGRVVRLTSDGERMLRVLGGGMPHER